MIDAPLTSTPHTPMPALRELMLFPVRTRQSRRDIVVGGLLFMLVPFAGWALNLGHRYMVMRRMYSGDRPWFRGFRPIGPIARGTLVVMWGGLWYIMVPATLLLPAASGGRSNAVLLAAIMGVVASAIGLFLFPAAINTSVRDGDRAMLHRPDRAWLAARTAGRSYIWAWCIAWTCIAISLLASVFFVVGFFIASAWAWSVIGVVFGCAVSPELRSTFHHGQLPADQS